MPSRPLNVVLLAAGQGTRMRSNTPKVLQLLAGKPLIEYVVETSLQLNAHRYFLLYGKYEDELRAQLGKYPITWIRQTDPLGTGHALKQIIHLVPDDETLLVLYGDVPLITYNTLQNLLAIQQSDSISLLTADLTDPRGYGRVVRQKGYVVAVVEQREATSEQLKIQEINSGILVANTKNLRRWLSRITNHNASNEYYLTDIIALAYNDHVKINTCQPKHSIEIQGVNDLWQLACLERSYQCIQTEQLSRAGITFYDPTRFDLRGQLFHGQDVIIDINVLLQGKVTLGNRVTIGAGCILRDCSIGDDCKIKPYSIIEESTIGDACCIGPFARLRPNSTIYDKAQVGNFVEIKQASLGTGSKANHLTYLGNCQLGERVNVGAGAITCNYNGVEKLTTVIGDDVHIGANSQLVAPITIGSGSTIGAGTTVTKSVPCDQLVISRIPQRHIQGWRRTNKKHKK